MTTKAKRVQVLGGPTSTLSGFTGRQREIIIDTTDWAPTIHDGVTPGGRKVQMQTGRLSALLGLGLGADKLVYATGADAFATTDLTALARSLLGGASTLAMRTTLGALATDGDGSAVTMLPIGATVPRTLAQVAGRYVYAEHWGVKADGVTDDTAALQAAIDSIAGTTLLDAIGSPAAAGGKVVLPKGRIKTTAPIVITKSGKIGRAHV